MQVSRKVESRRRRALVGCALLALAIVLGAPLLGAGAISSASGTKGLDELMNMRIKKVDGKHVSAHGNASGSVDGKVSFGLILSNGSQATASFSGSNDRGTISGTGVASYRVSGAVSYYTGTVTGLTGTGAYAHADDRGIKFSGSVNRRTYKVTMHLVGKWHV